MANFTLDPITIKFYRDWQELKVETHTTNLICLDTNIRTKLKKLELEVKISSGSISYHHTIPISIDITNIFYHEDGKEYFRFLIDNVVDCGFFQMKFLLGEILCEKESTEITVIKKIHLHYAAEKNIRIGL